MVNAKILDERKVIEQAYKSAFAADSKPVSKKNTTEIKSRLTQIEKTKEGLLQTKKAEANITQQITVIDKEIVTLKNEIQALNRSISQQEKDSSEKKMKLSKKLADQIKEYHHKRSDLEKLIEKKQELNNERIRLIRAMGTVKEQVEEQAEEMRNRRRLLSDMRKKSKREFETKKAVLTVHDKEYQKLILKLKKLEQARAVIRRLELAEEMKQRSFDKKQEQLRAANRKKFLICLEKIKAAKIARNAELVFQLRKELAELETYKRNQIRCAKRKFEAFKEKQRRLIEKEKIKLLDSRLLAELKEAKGNYLEDVKRALKEEIDKLRVSKALFDHERKVESKKLRELVKINNQAIRDTIKRQQLIKRANEFRRKQLLKAQMRTVEKEAEEYSKRTKRELLEKKVKNVRDMIRKTSKIHKDMELLDNKMKTQEKLLNMKSRNAEISTAYEKIQIRKLKDEFYKLAALKEKQKAQNQVNRMLLNHEDEMGDLDEIDRRAHYAILDRMLESKSYGKQLLKDTRANSKADVENLKKRLKKEVELKKKVLQARRCMKTQNIVNNELKKKQLDEKLRMLIAKAIRARIQSTKNCVTDKKLMNKVMRK